MLYGISDLTEIVALSAKDFPLAIFDLLDVLFYVDKPVATGTDEFDDGEFFKSHVFRHLCGLDDPIGVLRTHDRIDGCPVGIERKRNFTQKTP